MIGQTLRIVFLAVSLFTSPMHAETVSFSLIGGSETLFPSAVISTSQSLFSWHGFIPPSLAFRSDSVGAISYRSSPSGIWVIENGGRTTFTAADGTVWLSGQSSFYSESQSPGQNFSTSYILSSGFTGGFLDARMVGDYVTRNTCIQASFFQSLPPGILNFTAGSGPQIVSTPESSTLILLLSGGVIGVLYRKWRLTGDRGRLTWRE